MMVKITCPTCNTDGFMSLLQSSYQMSYRCWKCKEFYTLSVEDNQVKSMIKLTPEEYQKMKEVEDLRSKFKRQV
jgi:hypothetical protein